MIKAGDVVNHRAFEEPLFVLRIEEAEEGDVRFEQLSGKIALCRRPMVNMTTGVSIIEKFAVEELETHEETIARKAAEGRSIYNQISGPKTGGPSFAA